MRPPGTTTLHLMPTSLIIVDDFLGPGDAKGLREAALGLTYPEQ